MNNIDKFDIPVAEIESGIDLILLEQRLVEFAQKIENELSGIDPDIVFLVLSILKNGQITALNRRLNAEFDRLQEESERLIESADANTPEILKQRKEIASSINKLLDLKDKTNSLFDNLSVVRKIIKIAPKERVDIANNIVDSILSKLKWTVKPSFENN